MKPLSVPDFQKQTFFRLPDWRYLRANAIAESRGAGRGLYDDAEFDRRNRVRTAIADRPPHTTGTYVSASGGSTKMSKFGPKCLKTRRLLALLSKRLSYQHRLRS